MILKVVGSLVALSIIPCIYFALRKHVDLRKARQYQGVVVKHEPRRGSKGRTTYALAVKYSDSERQEHSFITRSSSNPPERSIGEKITVFHHADGSRPDVLVFSHLYLGYWIWFCVALGSAGAVLAPWFLKVVYLP